MNVLITGASGFLGSRLVNFLLSKSDVNLTAVSRKSIQLSSLSAFEITCLDDKVDWSTPLFNQDVVIHAASITHTESLDCKNTVLQSDFQRVNVNGTLNLARQAAHFGVKRFIFLSSIGVNGNANTMPFTENDKPNPSSPYAKSKLDAENGLWRIHQETNMEVIIIRPPLVYGANAPGSFSMLVNWVGRGIPLPLGSINNRRSFIALDNLVDFINICIYRREAANQVFLVSDGVDISTTELIKVVSYWMGKRSILISVPSFLLMFFATLFMKKRVAQQLLSSLQVDISKARNLLGWKPPISVDEGIRRCFVDNI